MYDIIITECTFVFCDPVVVRHQKFLQKSICNSSFFFFRKGGFIVHTWMLWDWRKRGGTNILIGTLVENLDQNWKSTSPMRRCTHIYTATCNVYGNLGVSNQEEGRWGNIILLNCSTTGRVSLCVDKLENGL